MRPVAQEKSIEVIRQYAILLENTVKAQALEISRLKKENFTEEQLGLNKKLLDELSRLRKKFFGFGRESGSSKKRPVGHSREELLVHGNYLNGEANPDENKAEKESDSAIERLFEMSEIELKEESDMRGIKEGSEAWDEVSGLYDKSVEITVTERVYQKVINKRKKYRLKDEYNDTGKEVIITAPGPAKLKPGCKYSIDFALAVVSDKYGYHLPLERQRRKMEAAGLDVDVKTLYRLCETVAEKARPVCEKIRTEIMNDFCAVHLDESPWRILGNDKSGYMWVMSNRAGSFYQFEPTRAQSVPKDMLKGYKGAIVTDGYGGYNAVRGDPKIRPAGCWSHARREFYERWDDYPNECGYAVELIDLLFAEERKARTIEELREVRKNSSPMIADALHEWMLKTLPKCLPEEGLAKAIQYCLNRWNQLTLFLKDLTVPLSNNDAERALRHAVVGRKNFAGSKTINGADTAATLYTVIESCKKASVQSTPYLKYLLEECWYDRELLTPVRWSREVVGLKESTTIKWPKKSEWQV